LQDIDNNLWIFWWINFCHPSLPIAFSGGCGVNSVEGCHRATNHIGINGTA